MCECMEKRRCRRYGCVGAGPLFKTKNNGEGSWKGGPLGLCLGQWERRLLHLPRKYMAKTSAVLRGRMTSRENFSNARNLHQSNSQTWLMSVIEKERPITSTRSPNYAGHLQVKTNFKDGNTLKYSSKRSFCSYIIERHESSKPLSNDVHLPCNCKIYVKYELLLSPLQVDEIRSYGEQRSLL